MDSDYLRLLRQLQDVRESADGSLDRSEAESGYLKKEEAEASYLKKSGGRLTGELAVGRGNGAARVTVDAAAGNYRFFTIASGGAARWQLGADPSAETGGNAGSDFYIWRYDDSGSYMSAPLSAVRATGKLYTNGNEVHHAANLPYSAGSWTPVITGSGGGTGVQSYSGGRYVRAGNAVHVSGLAAISSKGTISGNVRIGGLPFTCYGINSAAHCGICGDLLTGSTLAGQIDAGTNYIMLLKNSAAYLAVSDISSGFGVWGLQASYTLS